MRIDDYQIGARRTRNGATTPTSGALLGNAALGLAGESGEFCDHLKKHVYHGHPLDPLHLQKELGDILWYIAEACDGLGVTMSEVAEMNLAKLAKRYGIEFTTEKSMHREE